jgi:hypothetical protein
MYNTCKVIKCNVIKMETLRDSDIETERQRDRETERQRDRETERQKDRETEKQKDRKMVQINNDRFGLLCQMSFGVMPFERQSQRQRIICL